jgi:hypothetical protein
MAFPGEQGRRDCLGTGESGLAVTRGGTAGPAFGDGGWTSRSPGQAGMTTGAESCGRGAPTGAFTIAPQHEQVHATADGSSFVRTGQSQVCGGQIRALREGARRADANTDRLSLMVWPGNVVICLAVRLILPVVVV